MTVQHFPLLYSVSIGNHRQTEIRFQKVAPVYLDILYPDIFFFQMRFSNFFFQMRFSKIEFLGINNAFAFEKKASETRHATVEMDLF